MTDITDEVLDAILRESDGFWPPARERIQALIREHDASLIESLADDLARGDYLGLGQQGRGVAEAIVRRGYVEVEPGVFEFDHFPKGERRGRPVTHTLEEQARKRAEKRSK